MELGHSPAATFRRASLAKAEIARQLRMTSNKCCASRPLLRCRTNLRSRPSPVRTVRWRGCSRSAACRRRQIAPPSDRATELWRLAAAPRRQGSSRLLSLVHRDGLKRAGIEGSRMGGPRYAIYFVPEAQSDLYRCGSTILGYDCLPRHSGRLPRRVEMRHVGLARIPPASPARMRLTFKAQAPWPQYSAVIRWSSSSTGLIHLSRSLLENPPCACRVQERGILLRRGAMWRSCCRPRSG